MTPTVTLSTPNPVRISARRASLVHLLVSLAVALLVAMLIFLVWYPWPLHTMLGGLGLLGLVAGVDAVCGPMLTLLLWNDRKTKLALTVDCTLIACIQIAALGYGLYTVAEGRPVHVVFEVDRLRVVSAVDIDSADLPQASPELRVLPWTGPTWLSVRAPRDSDELLNSVELSLAGKEPSVRPGWWQSYSEGVPDMLKRARPLDLLASARSAQRPLLDKAVKEAGVDVADLVWLPLVSRRSMEWIVLLHRTTGQPLAYAPIDGFF